ncbi:MAG TPA: family 1 glycosylhydrolase [Geminicoccaceae bacterium]|nr:family 1 glycosylhydrolase [Geminicoccaceae bacterium]
MVFLSPPEVWGGLECTVARLGEEFVDQTRLTGHEHRPHDLDRFAALGIRAIRYPVLWERVAPDGPGRADWRWTDERLGRLRELGVRPIAGLLHHGNGPRHTDLAAPDFVPKFVEFATRVAERYPWVDAYTPINEPLTTARFCGLYGLWYPHARDHKTFLRILVNQISGVRLAMRAIRRVNPRAQLIQTEDLGRAHSTPRLAYQADYENERRWLTVDLLTGRVNRDHALWSYMVHAGLEEELEELGADPCPPDVVGIDHYLTSERFLDERLDRYPAPTHAGNGRDRYADLEAVRVVAEGVTGFENLVHEAWDRYHLPAAATEAHLGCTREEQLRWLKEIWDAALRLRSRGVDVRAVTAWALLGSYDWNTLLTRRSGYYEPGVFDVRAARPRPTALARMVRDLATAGDADHPALDAPGWWHRQDRFVWPPVRSCPYTITRRIWTPANGRREARALLITGGDGTLARAVARLCVVRGLPYHLLSRGELDVADPAGVAAAIERHRPWAIVNAAGFARVDRAEADPDRCRRENVAGAETLARACASAGIPLLCCSSHLVFDGRKGEPYLEEDAPGPPLGVYAASKIGAEQVVLSAFPAALVVRAGAFFGPWDDGNFVARAIRTVAAGRRFEAADDVAASPTYLPDLVNAALDLLIDGESGIWHLANRGAVTWADLAREAARGAGLDPKRVRGVASAELGWVARRPSYSALDSSRGFIMPSLEGALRRYFDASAGNPPLRSEPLGLIGPSAA